MHKQVVNQIVDNDLCIGCGVCAGVCPSRLLAMDWRDNGDLAVTIDGDCPPSCDLCLKVCPFVDSNPNEDELAAIRFDKSSSSNDKEIGIYSNTYVGYSSDITQRKKSASGGVITKLLKSLLDRGDVTSVFCVGVGNTNGRLFEFIEISDSKNLDQCASSKYYPVDAENVIKALQQKGSKRKIVITGLPCTLKAISLAMHRLPRVKRQVKYMIGLVCGLLPNAYYTEYLSSLSLGKHADVADVNYRSKLSTRIASNFNFIATDAEGITGKALTFFDVASIPYTNGMFQHNSCNFCDDVFAEVADLTVMDAWLPEYTKDVNGTSMLIVRSSQLENTILELNDLGSICIAETSVEKIKKSQQGVLLKKRDRLPQRLAWAQKNGIATPKKRTSGKNNISWIKSIELNAKAKIQNNSKLLWKSGMTPEELVSDYRIKLPLLVLKLCNTRDRIINLISDPSRLTFYIQRKISLLKNRSR